MDINFDLDFTQNDPSMWWMPSSTAQSSVPAPEPAPVVETTTTPWTSLEEPNLDINFDIEPDLTVEDTAPVQKTVQPQPVAPVQTEPTQNVVAETVPTNVEEPNLDINFDVEESITETTQEPVQPQTVVPIQTELTQNIVEETKVEPVAEPNLDISFDEETTSDAVIENTPVESITESKDVNADVDFDMTTEDTNLDIEEENIMENTVASDDVETDDYDDQTWLLSSYYKSIDLYQKIVSIAWESQYQMTHSESWTNYILTKNEDWLEIVRSDSEWSKTLSFDDSMWLTVSYNWEEILDFDEWDDETEEVTIVKNKIEQFIKELNMNYQSLQTENESNKKWELLEEVKNF